MSSASVAPPLPMDVRAPRRRLWVEYPRAATAASAAVMTGLPSSSRRAQHLFGTALNDVVQRALVHPLRLHVPLADSAPERHAGLDTGGLDPSAHRLDRGAFLNGKLLAITGLLRLADVQDNRRPIALQHQRATGAIALGLAEVEGEELRGPAQGPNDTEADQREVAEVLEVIGLHLAGEDPEVSDEPGRGLIGLAAGLARLAP